MEQVILGSAGLVLLAYVLITKRNEPAKRLVRLLRAVADVVAAWRS